MPNKTIYFKEEDLDILNRAQDLGGDSISALIAEALRRYVASEEEKLGKASQDEQVCKVVERIWDKAFAAQASHIHIQPVHGGNSVQLRIGTMLRNQDPIPKRFIHLSEAGIDFTS